MEFKIQRKENENFFRYPTEDVKIAQQFAQQLKNELQDLVIAVVVFGSIARKEETVKSDIDILVISDDVRFHMTESLIEGYHIIG